MIKAMIVDDEKTLRMMLRKMIERATDQIEVIAEAPDGRTALRLLEQVKPDLIFLDLQMPGMSGFEFLETAALDNKVQVVLSTGDQAFALKAYEFGITDYLLKPYTLQRLKLAVERVVKRKKETDQLVGSKADSMMLRLLKFMYTRDLQELKPVPMRSSLFGFYYPFLSIHYDFEKEQDILTLLEKLEKAGYLTSSFEQSVYLCNKCYNSYLNIRETCPKCTSGDLISEDILHHFSCGYVGPLEDFKDNEGQNALVCPKCDKTLRHIGVDYDKPSAIYHCNNCGTETQNPLLSSKCMNCGIDVSVENLIQRRINSFQITEFGKLLAKSSSNIKIEEEQSGVNEFKLKQGGIFERSLKKEILRKKQAEFECTISIIEIKNMDLLYSGMDSQDVDQLYQDLQGIVYNDLDPLAELEISRPDKIFVLMPEVSQDKAHKLVKRIKDRLELLLYENFPSHQLEIHYVVRPLSEKDRYNELIPSLIQEVGKSSTVS